MNNRFEYKVLERFTELDASPDSKPEVIQEPIERELNLLGFHGWELVCIIQEYNKLIYYMKKEKMW